MRRLIRTTAAATTGVVLATSLAVGTHAADNRGRPTTVDTITASSVSDPGAYWNETRMAQALPFDLVRERGRARVTVSDEEGNGKPSIAGIGLADESSGGTIRPASQPAQNYPFPFGRHYVEKQIRKAKPYRAIGRVFFRRDGVPYVCSGASVVSKPQQVVFTAGHCLYLDGKWSTDVVFVPGRTPARNKKKKNPFGKFPAKRLWVPLGWKDDQNDAFDMGAFSVRKNGQGKKLQSKVGALGFAYSKQRAQHWEIFGYPVGGPFKANHLTQCSAQWARDDVQDGNDSIGVGCDMKGGSSGGPWILRLRRGNLLNGITTYGYGDEPGAIYGPYFGANANWIRCAAATNDRDAQTC